jgi:vacuolar-type H+-ATPase subunit E/Vma4
MSFQDEIMEDVLGKAADIRSAAGREAAKIIAKAESDAAEIESEEVRATVSAVERRRAVSLSEAEGSFRAETGRAFEAILSRLREQVFIFLDERWKRDFASVAAETIIRGARSSGASEIDASFASGCGELFVEHKTEIKRKLSAEGITLRSVSFGLAARGGAVIVGADGRRKRSETFEDCFRRMRDDIQNECAERIGYGNFR